MYLKPNHGRMIALGIVLIALFTAATAHAKDLGAFKARIEAAFRAPERPPALLKLFDLTGADETLRSMYTKQFMPMLAGMQDPVVTFEPLSPDFPLVRVIKGWEYRLSPKPISRVVLNGKIKMPHALGKTGHVLSGMTRTKLTANSLPEQTLQIIVIGQASPAMRFKGTCTILQSNNKTRQVALGDNGHGNQTLALTAVLIERCEVTNLTGKGTLSLRLLEGKTKLFELRAHAPETTIRFKR